MNCNLCAKNNYEKIVPYDRYCRHLEDCGNIMNPDFASKLEDCKNNKAPFIYVCDDCLAEISGMNRIGR